MYQQTAPVQGRSGVDVGAWALVAVIVALVCGAAGWAIARQDVPGSDDIARSTALASRNGEMLGMREGIAQGSKVGRQEASLRTGQQVAQAQAAATREGYDAGYQDGRGRAEARAYGSSYYTAGAPSSSGAYPAAGYEDVLSSSMLNDAPGFSTSAYSDYGYAGSPAPYASDSVLSSAGGLDAFGW